ncbi:TAXI family TRAP transporter solute-binding subunit [Salsuginibacillus kocurii]|uniref:TAXI family TRAP transporter solute-binding subunit n=1 Tax=Salsuginibacillus kocurii TaxID=427078 RepID=UPI000381C3E6|nr:TAXI family TRAP transporter solute-binding subunit [Salsuginibacillus kocurii]
MKKFIRNGMFVTATGALLLAAACGDDAEPSDTEAGGEEDSETEEAEDSEEAEDVEIEYEEYPDNVVLGTASQGGTYYIYGGGIGSLLESELDVTANVEVTGGPVHNMQLTDAGDQDLGLITYGPGYEGLTGTGEWTGGQEHDNVRVTFPMYYTPFHWWSLAGSGVETIADLDGERAGIGPSGGTSGTYLPLIHDALGLDVDPVEAGASDMVSQQMDGQLDVIGFAAGIPISAVTEVESQEEISFFGIDGEERDQVIEELPYFDEFTIPADTYEQLDEDLETIAMFNFGIVNKEANEDFVYDMVKAYHENQEELMNTHSAAEEADIEAIEMNEDLLMHPGAIRFYEEEGIELPEDVYPPEWQD